VTVGGTGGGRLAPYRQRACSAQFTGAPISVTGLPGIAGNPLSTALACSVRLGSGSAATFEIHPNVDGQDIVSPQQVVWVDNSTPVNWFTQFQAFFQQLVDLLRRLLLSLFGGFTIG